MPGIHNPYLELWRSQRGELPARKSEVLRALVARDQGMLMRLKELRSRYTHTYAYAVPTERALFTINRFAPIIEIGAGTGYWSWLLRQLGTDIVCFDAQPPTRGSDDNRFHRASVCWTEVLPGDERVIDRYPGRTLFLCWPPTGDSMASRTLLNYRGEIFLYVGELPVANGAKACTGDDRFFQLLTDSWTQVQTVPLPNWEFCWDRLYVFRRH